MVSKTDTAVEKHNLIEEPVIKNNVLSGTNTACYKLSS